jgi:hypothetical protein
MTPSPRKLNTCRVVLVLTAQSIEPPAEPAAIIIQARKTPRFQTAKARR